MFFDRNHRGLQRICRSKNLLGACFPAAPTGGQPSSEGFQGVLRVDPCVTHVLCICFAVSKIKAVDNTTTSKATLCMTKECGRVPKTCDLQLDSKLLMYLQHPCHNAVLDFNTQQLNLPNVLDHHHILKPQTSCMTPESSGLSMLIEMLDDFRLFWMMWVGVVWAQSGLTCSNKKEFNQLYKEKLFNISSRAKDSTSIISGCSHLLVLHKQAKPPVTPFPHKPVLRKQEMTCSRSKTQTKN